MTLRTFVRVATSAARAGRARFARRSNRANFGSQRRMLATENVAFPKRPNLKKFFGAAAVSAAVTYVVVKSFSNDDARKGSGSKMPKGAPHIIISGAPGSGKGTQCENIVRKFGVVHISTGDILREHVKNGTNLGKKAKEYMSKGELVPDELVISMVQAKLNEPEVQKKGWLLDGFPRTPAQAKALDEAGIKADVFVQLDVPDDVLVERICGRRTDPVTGKIYHLKFNPPPADPAVQGRLVHRADDTEEALRTRLVAYHKNVNGILDFYKDILVNVNGHGNAGFKENVNRVQREIFQGINNARFGAPHIIISGAPGSGKGTQCENIVKQYGVVHISTGDILREHVKNGTDLGKQAKQFMEKGELVPDDLVISMVKAKLAEPEVQKKGWLLDGFPRTPAQAQALADAGVNANVFLQLEVPDDVLVERICGRRTDPVTGKIYHLKFNPPPQDPAVLNRLVHRKDDTEEALRTRLVAYHKNVNGILDFYKDIGVTVNGHGNAGFKDNVARVERELSDGIDAARQHC